MPVIIVVVVVVHCLLSQEVSATSCYSYQMSSGKNPRDSTSGSTQKDCAVELRAQQIFNSGVCIKSSFKDPTGAEVIMGACYPKCPPVMNGKQCIYPDEGGALSKAIADLTQLPNALYFCCCETDYCNAAGKVEFKWTILFSVVAMLVLTMFFDK